MQSAKCKMQNEGIAFGDEIKFVPKGHLNLPKATSFTAQL
jgi:hypothetical protein